MLPKTTIEAVEKLVPCRRTQTQLLSALLSSKVAEMPQAILVHGEPSTGKTTLLKHILKESGINHSTIAADQCITTRILLQKAFRAIVEDSGMGKEATAGFDIVCENVTAFYALLERFQTEYNYNKPHVIVLDRLDGLHENPSELFSCFTRLWELSNIKNLVFIFTISTLEPRALITSSIPHVRFTRYTKEEVVEILSLQELCQLPEDILTGALQGQASEAAVSNLSRQFWNSYVTILVDALAPYASSDVRLYQQIARRIWPVFVDPIITGEVGVRETVKLYRQSEHIFSSEFAVADSLVQPGVEEALKRKRKKQELTATYDLPLHSKYILVAAYLASYNPERYDIRFFSKAKDGRAKRRNTGRRKTVTLNPRMLAAPAFEIERMMAILRSIAPEEEFGTEAGVQSMSNIDLPGQIATLTTLKLMVKTSNDPLDSRTKWKVNAGWGLIERLAKEIDLPIKNYLIDEDE